MQKYLFDQNIKSMVLYDKASERFKPLSLL